MEHPATTLLGQDTTRGWKQETWNRWLGDVTSDSDAGTLEAASSKIKKDGDQTTATRRTAGWSHLKEKKPRVQMQPITKARTRQPPFGQRSHQERPKQNTQRRILSGKKQ